MKANKCIPVTKLICDCKTIAEQAMDCEFFKSFRGDRPCFHYNSLTKECNCGRANMQAMDKGKKYD